jgi:hypothetical protein
MNDNTHPYTLEVIPAEKPAGHFHWVIRKHGKLLQRSDRPSVTEAEARKRGMAEIEKMLHAAMNGDDGLSTFRTSGARLPLSGRLWPVVSDADYPVMDDAMMTVPTAIRPIA